MPVETMDVSATPFEGANYSEKSLIEDEIFGYVNEQWDAMRERLETVRDADGHGALGGSCD